MTDTPDIPVNPTGPHTLLTTEERALLQKLRDKGPIGKRYDAPTKVLTANCIKRGWVEHIPGQKGKSGPRVGLTDDGLALLPKED